MESSARLLSSHQTFIMKVLFTILWIGGFAAATVSLFLFPDSWHGAAGGASVVPRSPGVAGVERDSVGVVRVQRMTQRHHVRKVR